MLSIAALAYPAGRLAPVVAAVGIEYDRISDDRDAVVLMGPVALVSYRLLHTPHTSIIPEARGGVLIPLGEDVGVQIGASAGVVVATGERGLRFYVPPSVSRAVNLDADSDRATVAFSVDAGVAADL